MGEGEGYPGEREGEKKLKKAWQVKQIKAVAEEKRKKQ